MAITARTMRARSSPSRCGSVRPAWRPRDARTPAMLTPVRSVGIVSAMSARTAPSAAVANVLGPGSGAVSPTPSIAGLSRTACTNTIASHGAAIAAGTTTSRASPNAIAARCPVPAPRDRNRAVSVRRRSSSRAATRITAYAASTPNWTSSSRIPAWATRHRPIDRGEDVGQLRGDRGLVRFRQGGVDPPGQPAHVGRDRVERVRVEAVDVGDRTPLRIERLARGATGQVGLRDHERAAGGEPAAGLAALERKRIGQPVPVGGVGAPGPGDRDVNAPVRIETVDQRQRVAGPDAERGRRALGDRGLERRLSGRRPSPVDERGVILDALERGELREVGQGLRIAGRVRVGRRVQDLRDLAAGGREGLPQLRHDRRGRDVEAVGQDLGADDDSPVGRRRGQQLAVEAREGHGVRVQRPGREQRQGARQQGPRGEHDGQVRPAPPEHGGPEAERCWQLTVSRRVARGGRHPTITCGARKGSAPSVHCLDHEGQGSRQ